ncbi:hypothetical protein CROQUDRAFT_95396 [Cronartium quercuum f. sp. fusiforme G11]|uniref:Uncharacterized protein n=1 Tax=Cronartium quercuum f. sp. fusiforme G11 TaxID=708437 RepID=A0A9P6T9J7_9BASI|nr:hypothetical protein CROQUDRAFT_95396 [Cronartium quercuum f. sp. fusiforme G11]
MENLSQSKDEVYQTFTEYNLLQAADATEEEEDLANEEEIKPPIPRNQQTQALIDSIRILSERARGFNQYEGDFKALRGIMSDVRDNKNIERKESTSIYYIVRLKSDLCKVMSTGSQLIEFTGYFWLRTTSSVLELNVPTALRRHKVAPGSQV